MATTNNFLQYTSFDFATIKTDLINKLANDGVFKDYNFAGSNINQIVELFAGLGDLLNYYINMTANESFLRTCDLYENINKIVELVGYNPSGNLASTTTITAQATFISQANNDYFIIPTSITLTALQTTPDGELIKFSPTTSLTYVSISGVNTVNIVLDVIQGELITLQNYFIGTGEDFQKYEIPDPTAIEDFITVTIGGNNGTNAVQWDNITNIFGTAQKNIFSTRFDMNQLVEVQFGNTAFGGVPQNGANISISYFSSLNIAGAITSNQLTAFDTPIYLVDATTGANYVNPITFTIIQTDASIGQALPLTVDEIRAYASYIFQNTK